MFTIIRIIIITRIIRIIIPTVTFRIIRTALTVTVSARAARRLKAIRRTRINGYAVLLSTK